MKKIIALALALVLCLAMATAACADASVYYLNFKPEQDAQWQELAKVYTEKTGVVPNQFAADAYDVAYAILAACNNAGVTGDMSAEEICEAMIEQFTTMSFDGLTGQGMTWAEDGAVSKLPMAVKIENGVYVSAE